MKKHYLSVLKWEVGQTSSSHTQIRGLTQILKETIPIFPHGSYPPLPVLLVLLVLAIFQEPKTFYTWLGSSGREKHRHMFSFQPKLRHVRRSYKGNLTVFVRS